MGSASWRPAAWPARRVGGLPLIRGVPGIVVTIWVEYGDGLRALGTFLVDIGADVAGIAFLVVPNRNDEALA